MTNDTIVFSSRFLTDKAIDSWRTHLPNHVLENQWATTLVMISTVIKF